MARLVRLLLLPVLVVIVLGCSPGSVSVEQPDDSPAEAVKRELETAAESGVLGSEMISIQENLEKMRGTDPAKADELLADLEQLQSMTDPAAVKAKASEMIGKLEGQPESAEPE